jgi:hypothetical protein
MMGTKYFCDRCAAEIKDSAHTECSDPWATFRFSDERSVKVIFTDYVLRCRKCLAHELLNPHPPERE